MVNEEGSIEYNIIRSRRKTISIEITKDAKLLVRAPMRTPKYEIDDFVRRNQKWIDDHMKKVMSDKETVDLYGRLTPNELSALGILAEAAIPPKVQYYAEILGVTYGRISIRQQRTLWGSCNAEGDLSFNCLLMKVPEPVMDYVIVHELCHRIEMNHSARFWKNVEKVCFINRFLCVETGKNVRKAIEN